MSERVELALRQEARWLLRRHDATPEWQDRARAFEPTIDLNGMGREDYICPACYVRNDERKALESTPSGTRVVSQFEIWGES